MCSPIFSVSQLTPSGRWKSCSRKSFPYFLPLLEQIKDVHARYERKKKATNSMDFDDLLEKTLRMLKEHEEIAAFYRRQFQFILVDEYQDTNKIQADFIDTLASEHRNVMVVGDDAQSIYSWRGANFKNILAFPERYPDAQVFKIELNYRSVPEILRVANAAIAANVQQFRKELSATRSTNSSEAGGGRIERRDGAGAVHRPANFGTARRRN